MTPCSMSKGALAGLTGDVAAAEVLAAASGGVFGSSCCRLLGWGKDPHANARAFPVPSAGSLPSPSAGRHRTDLQKARLTPAGWGETGRSKRQCLASSCSVLISGFLNHRRGFVCGTSTMRVRN